MSKHMYYLSFCQTEQSSLDVLNGSWMKTNTISEINEQFHWIQKVSAEVTNFYEH